MKAMPIASWAARRETLGSPWGMNPGISQLCRHLCDANICLFLYGELVAPPAHKTIHDTFIHNLCSMPSKTTGEFSVLSEVIIFEACCGILNGEKNLFAHRSRNPSIVGVDYVLTSSKAFAWGRRDACGAFNTGCEGRKIACCNAARHDCTVSVYLDEK